MAINFPDTTGKLTDGSFTHDHLNNTWVWNGISWSIQNIISTYTNSDVNTLLNKDASSDGKVLSWDQNSDSYTWVDQPTVGTPYADSDVDTHLNQDGNISDGYVLSWDATADNNNGDYAWVAQSSGGGSSLWTQSNNDIYYNLGNVGIGDFSSTPPSTKLEIDIPAYDVNNLIPILSAGYNTSATGHASIAIGESTSAGNRCSIAIGASSSSSGLYSVALGYNNNASNSRSTAMGSGTTASGTYSTSTGQNTTAGGNVSFAMGYDTKALGSYSFASGYSTEITADGNSSIAMGSRIKVSSTNSFGIGLDNTVRTLSQANTMAIVGGKVGIETLTPSEKLEVDGAVKIGTTSTALPTGGEIKYDSNDFFGHNGTEWKSLTSGGGTQYTDSDVNTHLNNNNITSGYVLSWDQTLNQGAGDYAWIPNVNQTLGIIPTPPPNGYVLSWDTSLNSNQGGYSWIAQSSGGGSSVSISDSAPSSPSSGDLWWDSDNGNLKIYYTDIDSSQWVDAYTTEASSGGGGSSSSSSITDGTSTLSFDSNNNISIDTHIIPDTNASYDLGSAEYKIRHLFLSDNSLWIGDDHKIDTSDGTFKTRKRKKNTVPSSVFEAYKTNTGNSSATLQEVTSAAITWFNSESYSVTELNEITLDMWIKYLNSLDSTKNNVEDLYPPEYINDSENINYKLEDYDEVIGQKQEGKVPASITTEEGGFYNLILFKSKRMVIINPTDSININVIGAEPIDGNTVEFTVYIKQLDPSQEITGLQIDGLQVSQLRVSGFWSHINTPIPSPNQINICDVKAVCIGGQWFATVYWT